MYVTRPLSLYRKHPEALSEAPPAGAGSGYLVIQDEEAQNFCCFGLCKDSELYDFPFPQNKDLVVRYTEHHSTGEGCTITVSSNDDVLMIPVVGQPLSSNQYYASHVTKPCYDTWLSRDKERGKGDCDGQYGSKFFPAFYFALLVKPP